MDRVALLDQWKQANELELWKSFDEFPIEYATHLSYFELTAISCTKANSLVSLRLHPQHPILQNQHQKVPKQSNMSRDSSTDAKNDLSEVMEQLSVDIDSSDKTSAPPKSLSDMPVDVIALITEKLNYKRQMKLRKVSKSLREFVDKQEPACKSIDITFWSKSVCIEFDDQRVTYKNQVDECDVNNNDEEEEEGSDEEEEEDSDEEEEEEEGSDEEEEEGSDEEVENSDEGESFEHNNKFKYSEGIVVIRDDFEKAAFDDLASTLKNPKLQLDELSICFSNVAMGNIGEYYNKIQKILESLNHQVSVKRVKFGPSIPSCFLLILPYLKPKLLEEIALTLIGYENWSGNSTEMDQFASLDQWKQAEKLGLWHTFDPVPAKYAAHFKRFHINFSLYNYEIFPRIKKYLSELDNFEHCTLAHSSFSSFPIFVHKLLGEPVFRSATEEVFHHPIPDSDYFFEFKSAKGSEKIAIEKKKREDN